VLLGELVDELSMLVPELDVPELEVPDVDELSVEPIVPDDVLEGDVVLGDWVVSELVLGEAEESVDELCAYAMPVTAMIAAAAAVRVRFFVLMRISCCKLKIELPGLPATAFDAAVSPTARPQKTGKWRAVRWLSRRSRGANQRESAQADRRSRSCPTSTPRTLRRNEPHPAQHRIDHDGNPASKRLARALCATHQ
jgi:hypothetical protein